MTQEDKELLLNVLKDGLPYGLQLQITDDDKFTFSGELRVLSKNWSRLNIADPIKRVRVKNQTIPLNCIYIKPYLRPMSSMTEVEKKDILKSLNIHGDIDNEGNLLLGIECNIITSKVCKKYLEELNKRMFDVYHMIEKGLAFVAPKDMYNTKTE